MIPKILLVNPPIYDFAAYDFWLKPYGMLGAAGFLRDKADFELFDYLDRMHPFLAGQKGLRSDRWNRGPFYHKKISKPEILFDIPRHFQRFGLPGGIFEDFLRGRGPFDFVFIQTMMTYWYQGVGEVIEDVRRLCGGAKIVLGGNYVTLCQGHAEKLGADFLVRGLNLDGLGEFLNIEMDVDQPRLWQVYDKLNVGVLKLTDGCPFKCTYCSVPQVYSGFKTRPLGPALAELELLAGRGVKDIAFYDDALLFKAEEVLEPFLDELIRRDIKVNLHSPNALNARFVTPSIAKLMVRAGFKTFYLGFESASVQWQRQTGSKVFAEELGNAVEHLVSAGASPTEITAYQILGHPHSSTDELEDSMRFVNSLGIRIMLADFSPIPGTADGDYCSKWVDLAEPLMHNKTAFPIILLGNEKVNYFKNLCRTLNRSLAER